MMHQFKVGDRVRIIGPSNIGVVTDRMCPRIGNVGIVIEEPTGIGNYLVATPDDLVGKYAIYYPPESLELATHLDINYTGEPPPTIAINGVKYVRVPEKESEKLKPAIVIMREDGVLKPNKPPVVHESTSKAKEEAKRLAELHKGKEFVVFQEVDRKKAEKPVYPELKRGDVMMAKHKVDLLYGLTVADGEIVVVKDDGLTFFGAERGSRYLALRKSDFVKIGHIDL